MKTGHTIVGVAAIALLASCGGDDTAEDAKDYATWCRAYGDLAIVFDEVVYDASTPLNPESPEAQELTHLGEALAEVPVPGPIEDSWALAMPQNPMPPDTQDPVEQTRARIDSTEWIVTNCDLDEDVEAELLQSIAEDREYLDGIPATTG